MTKNSKYSIKGITISTPIGGLGASWDKVQVDVGEHRTSTEYIDGPEDEVNFDNYAPLTLRIDRRAYAADMATNSIHDQISIPRVAIDEDSSLWRRIDLSPKDGIHMQEDFSRAGFLYESAKESFHQCLRKDEDKRDKDPILDVIILNNSADALVIFGFSIIPVAAWTVPKQIPVPEVVRPSASYELNVKLTKRMSALRFDDPLLMGPKSVWRFSLKLADFSAQLNELYANECLLSISVTTSLGVAQRGPIYFGVL